jgi:HD-GYP domain-containing protein (c-di-GMP phosphodiesterase class II)
MPGNITSLQRVVHQGAIDALAMAHNYQDAYTGRHQRNATALARAISEELGLDPERIDGVALAASVHDLGKLAVPAEIINHQGPLTKAQFEVVQLHPVIGYNIMNRISMPWPIARIVAVADVLDALTTARPYRAVISLARALEMLTAGAGTLFDPEVVQACVSVIDRVPMSSWKEPLPDPQPGGDDS